MNFAESDGIFAIGLEPSGYDLPHPPIHVRVILLVRKVFIEAFALLRTRCAAEKKSLSEWQEDKITIALRGIIENDFRQKGTAVPGFDRTHFETVNRQSRVENYSLALVAKEPDMLFRLRGDDDLARVISTQNGLFVECKPVDAAHPAGGDYCDAGIIRFVNGDYAWAMQESLMVGYVCDGRTIKGHLHPAIATRAALSTDQNAKPLEPEAPGDKETESLHVTVHRRPFDWIGGKGPACPITVYHSWHQAN